MHAAFRAGRARPGEALMIRAMSVKGRVAAFGERRIYGRQRFQKLFHRLHHLALAGLNYGRDDPEFNGEYRLLDRLAIEWAGDRPVVFDVGGFRGDWSAAVLERAPQARVFTFEPNTRSVEGIRARLGDRVSVHHFAFGAADGSASLSAPPGLPEMGSLHVRDLQEVDLVVGEIESVRVTSIDAFCAEHHIEQIDLLKLDVEGHELAALQGAAKMLDRKAIDAIQFEFGGANVDSRVFLRDLVKALRGYRLFRILRDGLDPLDRYDVEAEIFAFCNFLALRERAPPAR